jgi:ribosomal protein L11 methyltransferase
VSGTDDASTARVEVAADPSRAEEIAAHLFAAGALGVWERPDTLVAWFTRRPDALGANLDTVAVWSHEPDRDWQEAWKRTIRPVRAGRFVVVPTWLADEHHAEPDDRVIVLDPGRAFGSGHHATTVLCLETLDELDRDGLLDGRELADVGCGSGILAIAAARCGAQVTAIDIDPAAVEATRTNAEANAVTIDVRHGSVDALEHPASIVVANLLTDVVGTLAERLVAEATDLLIVSGITEDRREVALGPLRAAGAIVTEVRSRGGWIAATLTTGPSAVAAGPADRRGSST